MLLRWSIQRWIGDEFFDIREVIDGSILEARRFERSGRVELNFG
jgi:hypothetical protein